ncbi:MAG: DUF4215 domain-containing protein, partial [Deltaproteobacteria bacterium]|nr:DUF4215 domain-containing protein [Deltaproteobacteria bacterium]
PEPYELELGLTCRICGDGVITGSEQCDDANTEAGDGCGPTCAIESCFTCANEPSICAPQPDGTACEDDFFCNGSDACIGAACSGHAGNPCPDAGECSFACDEEWQTCQTPLGKPCESDGDPCTHDACDAAGSCEHLADTSACRADVECGVAMILTPLPLLVSDRVEFTIDALSSVQIDTYDVAGTCAGPGTQLELFQVLQVLEDQSVELLSSAVADDPLQCPRIQTHLDGGDYAVEVTALFGATAPPVRIFAACAACGDGLLQPDENCDDGNTIVADGCSTCEVDSCYACAGQPSLCIPADALPCDDGIFCNGADTCVAGACASHAGDPCTDGECIDRTCDEGEDICQNNNWPAGSGCNDADACTAGDVCDGQGACHGRLLPECGAACGDASLDFGEECDDGNSASDDGCTTMCTVCGNGVLASAEQCDDGDFAYTPGDACAMDCTLVPCGRPVTRAGSMPMAKDALFVLRAAVGAAWCTPRVCDTDSSGAIDAIDGLRVLLRAVGGAVELDCPVGLGVTTTTTVPVSTTSSPVAPDIP